jgi:hypothetical protein
MLGRQKQLKSVRVALTFHSHPPGTPLTLPSPHHLHLFIMADHVQKNMERMVPEFEELQTSGMFTAVRPNPSIALFSALY